MTRVDPWAAWLTRYARDGRSAVVPRRAGAGNVADIVIYTRGRSEPAGQFACTSATSAALMMRGMFR